MDKGSITFHKYSDLSTRHTITPIIRHLDEEKLEKEVKLATTKFAGSFGRAFGMVDTLRFMISTSFSKTDPEFHKTILKRSKLKQILISLKPHLISAVLQTSEIPSSSKLVSKEN
nr:hypothetical protein Iba_chr02bCG8280 [Ipomoea batatas]